MLYIFDLVDVIIDIDFNRVLGVWSDYSHVPLAELQHRFVMNEIFFRHERGEITDQQFACEFCEEMALPLNYQQFSEGWLAIFAGLRQEVIDIMQQLRDNGHRVVVLSNTNNLHTLYWQQHYPQVSAAADALYLSQQMGLRKPDPAIYHQLLVSESTAAGNVVFFDDARQNIQAARQLGITGIQVIDRNTVPAYFAAMPIN